MEVILVQDVPNLGAIGELVKVKPGYGRNYLLPRKMAIVASVKNKKQLEHEKKVAGFALMKAKAEADALAKKINGTTVSIPRKVGEQDKMFGSVTAQDIAVALTEKGIQVDRKKVVLAEPIKTLGDFPITVKLRKDVTVQVTVKVVGE